MIYMYDVIKELLQIEAEAAEAIERDNADKEALYDRIERLRSETNEHVSAETDKTIQRMRDALLQEAEDKISEFFLHTQEQYARIEKQFYDNRQKWEDEIFEQILQ